MEERIASSARLSLHLSDPGCLLSPAPTFLKFCELKHHLTDVRFVHHVLTARTLERDLLEVF